ncbi:MAG: Stp1/IreP family PP2C-type Ser/Thr phosphatase [Deltaproteobacteria bacterium]|nr:Stp1/IreP family PP2C-type Ser/Thr phosphatase [Deltaproteobacteria bacterium]
MAETKVGENIHFWAATDVGKLRDHNEDNFLVDKALNLFVVADGMGGHAAGEIASAIAVKSMRDVVKQNTDLIEAYREGSQIASARDVLTMLEHAVQKACTEIYELAERESEKRGMGTTLSGLLIVNNRGFIAHVGDSRIYLLRGGRVVQLTEDHSLVNELIKRGKMSKEEAEQSPYKNAVTRAVGVYESVEVDTIDFDVLPGDQFLLASDGLHGYLENDEISPILQEGRSVEDIPASFIELANERGGKDNITNIVVRMVDPEGKAAALTQEVNLKIEVIRKMPLFKFLTYKELVRIMNITRVKEVPDGAPVINEGEEGGELFIVLAGSVRVHKGETSIVVLSAGDHFGEMALIDKAPRSASVSSVGVSKLLVISRADFFQIIRNEPPLATKLLWSFLQVLSARLRSTSDELKGARTSTEIEDLTEELFEIDTREVEA